MATAAGCVSKARINRHGLMLSVCVSPGQGCPLLLVFSSQDSSAPPTVSPSPNPLPVPPFYVTRSWTRTVLEL